MEMDPGVLMSMMNQEDNNGFEFIWILLIFLIFGLGGNGLGNRGGAAAITEMEAAVKAANCDQTQLSMVFDAIGGNRDAIATLSATLGTDTQLLQQAISGLSSGICELGYKMGMDSRDVITAVTTGNSSLQAELASCCCNTNRNIDSVRYDMALMKGDIVNGLDKGFCATGNAIKDATYALAKNQCDMTHEIKDGFCGLTNAMNNQFTLLNYNQQEGFQSILNHMNAKEMANLRDELSTYQLQLSQINQTQSIVQSIQNCCGCPPCCSSACGA